MGSHKAPLFIYFKSLNSQIKPPHNFLVDCPFATLEMFEICKPNSLAASLMDVHSFTRFISGSNCKMGLFFLLYGLYAGGVPVRDHKNLPADVFLPAQTESISLGATPVKRDASLADSYSPRKSPSNVN